MTRRRFHFLTTLIARPYPTTRPYLADAAPTLEPLPMSGLVQLGQNTPPIEYSVALCLRGTQPPAGVGHGVQGWGWSLALVGLLLAGCASSTPAPPAGATVQIGTLGNQMRFVPEALTLPAGQPISLTFTNQAAVGWPHNWVLIVGGDDVAARIDAEGLDAGAASAYLPNDPAIQDHTRVLEGGENETITVAALPAGTYSYICTVPGHYQAGMKGVLTVR